MLVIRNQNARRTYYSFSMEVEPWTLSEELRDLTSCENYHSVNTREYPRGPVMHWSREFSGAHGGPDTHNNRDSRSKRDSQKRDRTKDRNNTALNNTGSSKGSKKDSRSSRAAHTRNKDTDKAVEVVDPAPAAAVPAPADDLKSMRIGMPAAHNASRFLPGW